MRAAWRTVKWQAGMVAGALRESLHAQRLNTWLEVFLMHLDSEERQK